MRRSRSSMLEASRFYSAFYRWTVFISRPHRQPRLGGPIDKRYFHLYPRLRNDGAEGSGDGDKKSAIRKWWSSKGDRVGQASSGEGTNHRWRLRKGVYQWRPDVIREMGLARTGSGQGSADRDFKANRAPHDDSWLQAEVLTSAQKPFDTLGPWGEVVRYNSSAGVMLQLALPLEAVEPMRVIIGTDPQMIKNKFGASAELGQKNLVIDEDGSSVQLQSVLISGGRAEASGLRHAIISLQQRVKKRPELDPEAQVPRTKEKGHRPSQNGVTRSSQSGDRHRSTKKETSAETRITSTAQISQSTPENDASGETALTSAELEETMKQTLRALSHPVAVVLAASTLPRTESTEEQFIRHSHGVTISSLTAVTLAPETVVSFNLKLPSRTWDAMSSSPHFSIHLLRATPEAAGLARTFTLPHANPSDIIRHLVSPYERRSHGELKRRELDGSNNTDARILFRSTGGHCSPRLSGPSILARLTAVLDKEKSIKVGDHVIVVAKITGVLRFDNAALGEVGALAYAKREYRGIGAGIEPVAFQGVATSEVPEIVEEVKEDEAEALDAVDRVEEEGTITRDRVLDELGTLEHQTKENGPESFNAVERHKNADENTNAVGLSDMEVFGDAVPSSEKERAVQSDVSDEHHDVDGALEQYPDVPLPSYDEPSPAEDAIDPAASQQEARVSSAAAEGLSEDSQDGEQADLAVFESMSRYDEDNDIAEQASLPEAAKSGKDIFVGEQDQPVEVEQNIEITDSEAEMEKLLNEAQKEHDTELANPVQNDASQAPVKETFASEKPNEPKDRGPIGAWGL